MDDRRREALDGWYEHNRRPLPWRNTTDPWAILVSEVMLQQTQASRVAPVYGAFLHRFPRPATLAAANPGEVVEAWAGLGYQRRAFFLWRAAQAIAGNGWPTTVDGLRELPGVGPYTAAAVACFAFGVPVAAVDTNLRRVLSRWEGRPLAGSELQAVARRALDEQRPSRWNQAMMDLGASVCRPRTPCCGVCPVAEWCANPDVYQPPPRQSRYEGSHRQARATVLRTVAGSGPVARRRLPGLVGMTRDRVEEALEALASENMVVIDGPMIRMPGADTDRAVAPGTP